MLLQKKARLRAFFLEINKLEQGASGCLIKDPY